MERSDEPVAGVVEGLPVGVFALDGEDRLVVWNAAAERLTGWPRSDVLGLDAALSTTDRPTVRRILDELRAGRPFSGRLPGSRPGGRSLYFRAVPGPGTSVVGVLQDVADTRAEDEAFALLDALWETAPVGLAYFDTDLRYRRVNGAVLDIDGGTTDQRLGRTLEAVHGAVGAAITAGLAAVLVDGRARVDVPVEGRLWHGRGRHQAWRMNYYPVRGGEDAIIGVGVVLVDVTEAERNRRELAELAAQREHALNRYQSLVDATSAAVWTRAADGSAHDDAPGLRAITGQGVADHDGWGFLDAVHPAHRERLGAAWRAAATAEPAQLFTRDYRLRTAAGSYRWFRTRAVPVHSGGRVVEWIGTETDVDDRLRARDRLDVLAQAGLAMNAARDPEAELVALAEAVVPRFADVCRIYLVDPDPPGRRTGALTGRRSIVRRAPGVPPSPSVGERFSFAPVHPLARCVRTVAPVLVEGPDDALWRGSPEQQRWSAGIGLHSMLVAPLVARGSVVAALLFLACGDRPPYTEDDLALVTELATRASAALETATEFQQSREVSVALQSAMLSRPPDHPGVEVEARYLPAAPGLQVGGDWYDAFALPGGDLAVGVGDVVGHDLPAAVAMGQLRSMLRGLAHDSEAAPSVVLGRLDRVVSGLAVTPFTTLIYGRLTRAGGRTRFRWSNAGHPAPLLVGPDGEPRPLAGAVDHVLGVAPDRARREQVVDVPAGSVLLLHTDGLSERRNDPDDRAAPALLDLVRAGAGLALPELCDHLIRGSTADTGDDIVVLALRVLA